MKFVFQTRQGSDGNCWPACIASILDLTIEETDHLSGHLPEFFRRTDEFLRARGLYHIELSAPGFEQITAPPDGSHLIVGCTSKRGFPHACIAKVTHTEHDKDGEAIGYVLDIVHDPADTSLEDCTHYKIDSMVFLCRL